MARTVGRFSVSLASTMNDAALAEQLAGTGAPATGRGEALAKRTRYPDEMRRD